MNSSNKGKMSKSWVVNASRMNVVNIVREQVTIKEEVLRSCFQVQMKIRFKQKRLQYT